VRGVSAALKNCGCPTGGNPVCAAGKTYENACLAKCAGIDIQSAGACAPPSKGERLAAARGARVQYGFQDGLRSRVPP
jgi:hypothetical protein